MSPADLSNQTLLSRVHRHLRAMAVQRMARERPGHTLQATALVNEAWMALRDQLDGVQQDSGRFYLAASESMRRILIDHARRRNATKRGGDMKRLSLDLSEVATTANLDQVLTIDEAITALEEISPRGATLVRLRFFAGLDGQQAAQAMQLSERTLRREWAFVRAWLHRKLTGRAEEDSDREFAEEPATGTGSHGP